MSTVRVFTEEVLTNLAASCSTKKEFRTTYKGAYEAACRMGILQRITSHLMSKVVLWTPTLLREEALKYHTLTEFAANSKSAYEAARKRGILDDVCAGLSTVQTAWTYELLSEVASRFSDRGVFKSREPNAYRAACQLKVLQKTTTHMPKSKSFNLVKPAIAYYFKICGVYKIGITNKELTERYYSRDYVKMSEIKIMYFNTGSEAREYEKFIMSTFKEYKYTGETPFTDGTGVSECFIVDVLNIHEGFIC